MCVKECSPQSKRKKNIVDDSLGVQNGSLWQKEIIKRLTISSLGSLANIADHLIDTVFCWRSLVDDARLWLSKMCFQSRYS